MLFGFQINSRNGESILEFLGKDFHHSMSPVGPQYICLSPFLAEPDSYEET
jgi:hypothetical protein